MRQPFLTSLLNRATAEAGPPVPFSSRAQSFAFGLGGRRDATAQMAAMGGVGTLFSIVNRTSNATSQVDWKLWRKAASGRKEDRVEVTSHAALDLWNKPNPFMPRQEFVEVTQQHIDLTGEGPWVVSRHKASPIPLELWPVRPDRITPIPDPERFLAGYMYQAPDGQQIALELDQVIFLRMPNPLDPFRGMGPVQSILTDLDATRYSAEWNRNFFLNSAEPGGIIEVPNALSDPDFDQLRERWDGQHRGVANAHRVAILEHGKWIDRKYTQRDMQFVELRSVSRDVIREAFGIPAFALGEVQDVNRATAEASSTWFAEMLTVPRLERIKAALNHDLLPMFGPAAKGLEFDYEDPIPPDVETEAAQLTARATAARTLIDAGFSPEAVLSAVGLPEIEAAPAAGGEGQATPRELADMIQSIYLGVDTVVTWEEAREIVNRAGGDLDLSVQPPAAIRRSARPGSGSPTTPDPHAPEDAPEEEVASSLPLGPELAAHLGIPDVQAAQRWEAVSEDDDNTCEPCRDNNGQTYRNRAAAYRDYPGGSGYIHCVGAEFGNDCRCKVVKRGKAKGGDE
ncbi:phage portal protein [Streptomyces avidinii]|uniref:phage portal protein n=1 Tax=Streptomyces avidinii TaxID=1895 RepID=UPI003864FB3D|nr:phage portal protein [Streptomyces avidinii]